MVRRVHDCDLCGKKGARVRRVTRSYGRGAGEYLIRNVPTISCPHRGETYLTAETVHELERIKADHRNLAVQRRIPIADFSTVRGRRAS